MSERSARARVDPELRRQLFRAAAAKTAPVEAVMRLRPTRRSAAAPAPQATRDTAQRVVGRVAKELGTAEDAYDLNVFPHLGYFVLSASAGFVRRVLDQPEVASASANRRRGRP
jgi:hypothetical protein